MFKEEWEMVEDGGCPHRSGRPLISPDELHVDLVKEVVINIDNPHEFSLKRVTKEVSLEIVSAVTNSQYIQNTHHNW